MVLTSQTVVDIVDKTQTITFYESASQVDQITFSNNQITLQNISQYILNKNDYLLWFQYLNTFYSLINFNYGNTIIVEKWPLCEFDLTESNPGFKHIKYTQSSQGNQVISINYNTHTASALFEVRVAPITISISEFFMCMNMLNQYTAQINQN